MNFFDSVGGNLCDATTRTGRASERNHVDFFVRGHCFADNRPGASNKVEHACRQTDFVDDLSKDKCVDWCDLAWLENDRATCCHRECNFGDDLVQRVVPRGDATDDADWFAHDK